jgi:hypothetical protein
MIAIIRKFFIRNPKQAQGKNVSFYLIVKRACLIVAKVWWAGMQPAGRALRDEIEALEQLRDRWRSR